MSIDEAREVLAAGVGGADAPNCGVCGVPQRMWWSAEQRRRHQRYHQAQAVAAGAGR